MKKYRAYVKVKETKETVIIESEYNTKTDFIKDLRLNGYCVYNSNVEEIK